MEQRFEVTKNVIIVFLIAIIMAMGTHDLLEKIWPKNTSEMSQNEFVREYDGMPKEISPLEEAILYLEDENTKLVESKREVQNENIQLKKKVDYYFEFYRKNQPVGIEVAEDTAQYPYWKSEIKFFNDSTIFFLGDSSFHYYTPDTTILLQSGGIILNDK